MQYVNRHILKDIVIYYCNKGTAGKENKMENKGMTDFQFKAFLETLLRFIENEEKEKAIDLIKSLLNKN